MDDLFLYVEMANLSSILRVSPSSFPHFEIRELNQHAVAWRNKAFGSALDFCWGSKDNSNDYAIRESATSVKLFRNFIEKPGAIDFGFQAEGLSGMF